MKRAFIRITGFALILASIAGLLFSIVGIIKVWQEKENLTHNLLTTVDLLDSTLQTTSQGLAVADASLEQATINVDALGTTLTSTGRAIEDIAPLVEEISTLMADDLPEAILATQTALTSAQSSARLIEGTLRVISNIPLLPIDTYDPPVPLDVALGNVVVSLDPLPDSLGSMESALNTSQGNLTMIQAEFNIMARHVTEINASLAEAQQVIIEYQDSITTLHEQIVSLKTNLPFWMNSLAWFVTIALIWLALTQLGLLAQGLEMFGWRERID